MTEIRTFRIVDEDGDYYETVGDPVEAFERVCAERDQLAARIAELERERAALADELAEADPEYTVGDGISPWTRSTYTNAEAARECAELNGWRDAVVMRRIVGEWAELVSEPDDTAGSAT